MNRVLKKVVLALLGCVAISTVAYAGWKISMTGPFRMRTNNWKVTGNGAMSDRDATPNGVWTVSAAGTQAIWHTDGFGTILVEWDPGLELYRTRDGYTIEFLRAATPEDISWTWEWRDDEGQLLAQGGLLPD